MNRAVRRRRRLAAVAALAIVAVAILLVVRGLAADTRGARVVRFTVHSRLVHRDLPVAAVVPAGHASGRRPLIVFLHGKGEDQDSNLDGAMYAALARQGSRAPDVVFPLRRRGLLLARPDPALTRCARRSAGRCGADR